MNEVPGRGVERRFIAFDKTPLFYRLLPSALKEKRATLLVLHGMGEHGGRYREFSEFLSQQGVECLVPDLRGFGMSGGKRACLRRFSDYFKDLDALYHVAQAEKPAPFFILGHSYGGLIVSSWLSETPGVNCRGLILTSPNFAIAIRVPAWRHWLAMAASYLVPNYAQDNRVDPGKLTHDREVLTAYQKDPLIYKGISARLYREMICQLARTDQIAQKIHSPTLVLQAGDDRVVSKEVSRLFYEKLASKDKTFHLYEGLFHELLHETSRRDVYSRISYWIVSHSL